MDSADRELHRRLAALADAVPIPIGPGPRPTVAHVTIRSRASGLGAVAIVGGLVLVLAVALALSGRGMPAGGVAAPASPTASPSASASMASPAASSPSPSPTRPASDLALPYPDGCATYGLSVRRCAYIVDWALTQAGVPADHATIELLGDPACAGEPAGCVAGRLVSNFVVRIRVVPTEGPASDHPVFCGPGSDTSLLCSDTPLIRVSTAIAGYHDVPCGSKPAPGGCATPVPTIAPADAASAAALRIADLTIPIDHTGPYSVDVGDAVLPNGILSEATASLADDRRADVIIRDGIRLEIVGPDGKPLLNAYDQGWRPGTERVHARLVFTVESFEPGTTLELTDIVVR